MLIATEKAMTPISTMREVGRNQRSIFTAAAGTKRWTSMPAAIGSTVIWINCRIVTGTERSGTARPPPSRKKGRAQLRSTGMVKTVTRLESAVSTTASATLQRPQKVDAFDGVQAGRMAVVKGTRAHSGSRRDGATVDRTRNSSKGNWTER